MKAVTVMAAAAALAGTVSANRHHGRAHKDLFAARRGEQPEERCNEECKTVYFTETGPPGLWSPPNTVVPTPSSASVAKPTTTTITVPGAYDCPTTGVYTFPATTLTVTSETTLDVKPTPVTLPPGTYTAPSTIVTITETSTVFYCPFTSDTPTSTAVQTTAIPTVIPTTSKVIELPTSSIVPSSSSSSKIAEPSKTPTGGLGGSDGKWAMTYSPYYDNDQCKTDADINKDVAQMVQYGAKVIRVYSSDCEQLPAVGKACKEHGCRLIVGVYIGSFGCSNAHPTVQEQITALSEWEYKDLADLVVVANEAVFNGYCDASQLKTLISTTKSTLQGAGYSCPFTTTDVVSSWTDKGMEVVCDEIDVVAANSYAFFNAQTAPKDAGDFVASQLKMVEGVCGNKLEGYVLETGWPWCGQCYGPNTCPGRDEQKTALASIKASIGDKACVLSAFDDGWKEPGAYGVEVCWGAGAIWSAL